MFDFHCGRDFNEEVRAGGERLFAEELEKLRGDAVVEPEPEGVTGDEAAELAVAILVRPDDEARLTGPETEFFSYGLVTDDVELRN